MSKRDPYAFIQIGRKYLLVDSIVSWEQTDPLNGQLLYITMTNGYTHEFADPEGEHLARLVDEFTMDPPETGFVDCLTEQAEIRAQFQEAAERLSPKPDVQCECEVCVEERITEAFNRELGALAKQDYLAIRTLKGGLLDETDAKWWLGLGSTVRAETRPTLMKMAETDDPKVRGKLLGELLAKTLFGFPASKAR